MWSINQKTGVLRGHRNGHHEVAFTKNENEAGNGDIDAYDSKDSLDEGYVAVDLLLRRR